MNNLLNSDAYLSSHFQQDPPGTTQKRWYISARGGPYPVMCFFGPQYAIHKYLSKPITEADCYEAKTEWGKAGLPFNMDGAMYIVEKYDGYIPCTIWSVPEGSIVPVRNSVMTIESVNDPDAYWATALLEDLLLSSTWGGTTPATRSWWIKQCIKHFMLQSCDNLDKLPNMLVDFMLRGCKVPEQAMLSGAGHLINFTATDNMAAIQFLRQYYYGNLSSVIGTSIPASAHSTTTAWGREHEFAGYDNMIEQYKGKAFANVVDSYNIFRALKWWYKQKQRLIDNKSHVVLRPDSGKPIVMSEFLVKDMLEGFGSSVNTKGYQKIHPVASGIQGDGNNEEVIHDICQRLVDRKYAVDNICFGMGGELGDGFMRDTMKWKMALSTTTVDGYKIQCYKDPILSPGKRSRSGDLWLYQNLENPREFVTDNMAPTEWKHVQHVQQLAYEHGMVYSYTTLEDMRYRSEKHDYTYPELLNMRWDSLALDKANKDKELTLEEMVELSNSEISQL